MNAIKFRLLLQSLRTKASPLWGVAVSVYFVLCFLFAVLWALRGMDQNEAIHGIRFCSGLLVGVMLLSEFGSLWGKSLSITAIAGSVFIPWYLMEWQVIPPAYRGHTSVGTSVLMAFSAMTWNWLRQVRRAYANA